jgi:ectoine hydroxylase-related dioxygenase (phytanoyl-CoA dioxygenase family)
MIFKKVKYNFVQKYDPVFQGKFVSHYMIENKISKKFKKDQIILNLSKETRLLENYILDTLFKKKLISRRDIHLNQIHKFINLDSSREKSLNDVTRNNVTAAFFNKDKNFFEIYDLILKKVKKKLKFKFLFQKDPFIRFNFPTKNYFDTLLPHVDLAIGHPPGEINLWTPLTDVTKNNSIAISNLKKSMEFFGKYSFDFDQYVKKYNFDIWKQALKILKPFIAKKGKTIIFDSRVMHKSILNNSSKTRVSLDYRILPIEFEKIARLYRGTGYKKQKFSKGNYYSSRVI